MSFERLQSSDRRLVLVVLLVILISAVYISVNYRAAFPQASIDLRYSKDEITRLAEDYLEEQGYSTNGFRQLTLFSPDSNAQFYLERELGLEEANRLMEDEVSVWRWRARWFRPPDEEELIVRLSPGGRVVGFSHVIPEAEEGARLERDAAHAIAEAFLTSRTSEPHRLIEEQTQERPNRLDYVFTWEREGFRAADAGYRSTVVIQGREVGRYSEYLHVPEQWQRDFAKLRSSNELFQWIAQAFYIPLIIAAIILLIRTLRHRVIPWRALIILCAGVGILATLNELNLLPFLISGMQTSMSYPSMLLLAVLTAMGAGVGAFFYVAIAGAPGEPLYRASQPAHLSLPAIVSRRGFRTREFFRATVTGYGFAAAHIAFVVAFYLVGRRFGVWSPQDIEYSDLLSTAFPWIYPLAISVLASTSEEFWFRLLAIPLLKRYLRSTWLAVLIPAFVWGFLHSNYPQQPGFIRGIEVGVIGVAAGFLMLRYGILSTLIWHYTVDAIFIGTFLLQADSWYYRGSALVVAGAVLLPLALSLFFYKRHGGFLTEPELLNAALPEPPPPLPAPPVEVPEPLPPKLSPRWLYVAAAAALLLGLIFKPQPFGDFVEVRISSAEAQAIADRALRARDVNPAEWQRTATFVSNLRIEPFEYLRREGGEPIANRTVRARTRTAIWSVRYVQPLESEEWRVLVDQQGTAYRLDHVLDEDAPGAQLTSGEARKIAEQHLVNNLGVAVDDYRLVDSSEQKLDHRTDHSFVWEDHNFRVGEATARISLSVVGDEVSFGRSFVKLPEEWLREFRQPRLRTYIIPALAGAIGVPLLIVLISRLSHRRDEGGHHFRWRLYVTAGAVAAALTAIGAVNQWTTALASYDTAKPLDNFLVQLGLVQVISVLVTALGIFLLTLSADVFLQLAAGYRAAPRPSLLRTVAAAVFVGGVFRFLGWADQITPGDRLSLPIWSLTDPSSYFPALTVLSGSILSAAFVLGSILIVTAAAVRYLRNRTGYLLGVAILVLTAFARANSVGQWTLHFFTGLIAIGVIWFLIRTNGVDLITFGVAFFWLEAANHGIALAEQPANQLQVNGIVALVVAAALGVLLIRRFTSMEYAPANTGRPAQ